MKIKTRLQVSIILCIVLTVTIGLFVFMAIQKINDKSQKARIAAIIVKDMAELNISTHEYLLHPGERPLVQWKSKYDSLANRLTREENKSHSPDEKIDLNKIHQNLVRLGTVFSNLTTGFVKKHSRQKDPISSELQDRLIGELLIKSQSTISPVFHLQRVIQEEIEVAQKRSSFLIIIFLVVFIFLVVGILFWINKSIARPIIMLEEGTQIIGAGNLNHKVGTEAKNEIGALSRSFDKMTEDLKNTTTSIFDLNEEIAERKQAEEALREREQKYRTLLETTSEGCWLLNPELKTIEVNQALCNMLGYSQDEMIGKTPFDFVDDENRKVFIEQTSKISGTEHRSYEITLKKKNGQDLQTYFNATTIRDESGELQGSFAFVTDITEKKQAEEELNRLAVAIEQTAESVFITDRHGTIQYANPAFEHLTGYSRKDAIGQNPRILKSGKHNDLFYKQMWDTLTRGDAWHGRIVNRKKDGSFYEADATISPVLDKSGKITNFVSIKRDVTHEIELEKRLIQAQKMESIGTLAGGIAHDFNNVLFSIIGYTDLTMDDVPEDSLAQNNLKEVLIAANRAKDMVQQILTFSRQAEIEKKPIKVQSVVKEAIKLLKTSIPTTIEIRQNIDADCKPVLADPTQIHQVVMNLATNAYCAMREKGGVLTINVAKEKISIDDSASYPDLNPGAYIKLTVSDTGYGMDKMVIDKIFDPYFTTKPPGEGTGMGLSTVHGVVKSHGGDIKVYSESGKGTVFYVYFPLIETKPVEPRIVSTGPIQKGSERILVVDDEEQIISMVKQLLESLGYQVATRASSVDALEAFRANSDKFDLVITDMTMPNMTGVELAPMLLEIRPDIPIILCTGFSEITDANKAKALGIREFLMKPLIRDQIARTIRKVLDS